MLAECLPLIVSQFEVVAEPMRAMNSVVNN